ncbi:MAG: acetylglutamate kinase [Actinomycetota bacterium]
MSTVSARTNPDLTAQVLTEALPYIQRFRGATVVVKFGGNAMIDPELSQTFAADVVLMHSVGIKPVVVHGGGPQIASMLNQLGKESAFVDGLRVTDAETLDVARMVLGGKVSRDIVSAINVHGPLAVGVSGEDAGLIRATPRNADLGYVGDVADVNPAIIHRLLAEDMIPVVSSIGSDGEGQPYNINADTVAGHLAAAVGAQKLIVLTDVDGMRRDPDDPSSLIQQITAADLHPLVGTPTVNGGMIPKVEACLTAVDNGVASAHMINGTLPHVLLLELFTDSGIGTMIRGN